MSPEVEWVSIEIILVSLGFTIAGQILLKQGMSEIGAINLARERLGGTVVAIVSQPRIYLGFVCNGVSAILWVYALSRVDLSFAHPFLALNIVLTTIGARIVLKEHVSGIRWIAISIAAAGLILVAAT